MKCMEQVADGLEVCPYCGHIEGSETVNAMHITPGEILHDRYIIGCAIGCGGFGVTYIAWDALLQMKVAIKEYMPSEFSTRSPGTKEVTVFSGKKAEQFATGKAKFHDEAKKLARFHTDDGVVRVYDTFEENHTAYIIMELLEGETLDELLKREKKIPYERAIQIILPIAEALRQVHREGVIHRDIAPDNIFLSKDGKIKLIDFGAARFATTSHSRSLSVLIKQGYSPEEQYRSCGDQGPYTDVYALGAVLYHMVTGVIPPDALERRAFFENKKKDILPPISKYTKDVPQDKQNAILNALNVRIEDRTQTAEAFIHELTTDEPVKRKSGKIKALDFLSWPLWAKIGLPTAALCITVFMVLLFKGIIFPDLLQRTIYVPDGMSRVPSIVNTNLSDATVRLNEEALQYKVTGKKLSAQVPENLILLQNINGGAVVLKNTVIVLDISAGTGELGDLNSMPDLVYMSQAKASAMLCSLGIQFEWSYEENETVERGLIISQDAEPGTALEGLGTVHLTVSKGGKPFSMPDVRGLSEESAKEKLYSSGLSVTVAYGYGSAAVGTVLSQDIPPNEDVRRGDIIEITVCTGEELFAVPDVCEMRSEDAVKTLSGQGFSIKTNEEYMEDVEKGVVAVQMPAADTMQKKNSVVLITVSKGKEPIDIPQTKGFSKEVALSTLEACGFEVEIQTEYSESIDKKAVLSQSPADGTAFKGDTITVVVSNGPKPRDIPNLIGISEQNAADRITALDLNYQTEKAYDENIPAGNVISQSPNQGTLPKGGTVSLTVSQGPKPRTVPKLVGQTRKKAEDALSKLGLQASITQKYDNAAAGTVISQSPSSGTLNKGDTVELVISSGAEPIYAASVKLNRTSKMLNTVGNSTSFLLTATVSPANADDTGVTWQTSDKNIATVDAAGTIRAVKDGTCTITAKSRDGKASASCNVTVKTAYDTQYGTWSEWSEKSVTKTDLRDVDTKTQTVYGAWGGWSDWSDTSVTKSDSTEVETREDTRSRLTGYNMVYYLTQEANSPYYRNYREFSLNGNYGAYGARTSYGEHHNTRTATVDQVSNAPTIGNNGFFSGEFGGYIRTSATAYDLGDAYPWFVESEIRENYTVTQYRYRTRTSTAQTLYRYRDNKLVPKEYD